MPLLIGGSRLAAWREAAGKEGGTGRLTVEARSCQSLPLVPGDALRHVEGVRGRGSEMGLVNESSGEYMEIRRSYGLFLYFTRRLRRLRRLKELVGRGGNLGMSVS